MSLEHVPSPATQNIRAFARFSAAATFLIGVTVLIGWAIGSAALKGVLPNLVPMNPVTAVAFVLCGGALWLIVPEHNAAWALHSVALIGGAAAGLGSMR